MPRVFVFGYRLACIGILIALVVLSLLPANGMHRTELGGHAEHLLAYLGTALVLGIGAGPGTRLPLLLTLIVYGGLLESLQMFSPGRTPQVGDFLYSAAGVVVGMFVARLLQTLLRWETPTATKSRVI